MEQQAADDGFDGLDMTGYGTFPIVKLDQGEFVGDGITGGLGTEFYCKIQGSREKILLSNGLKNNQPGYDFRYTYDRITTHKGENVDQVLAEWRAAGLTPAEKKYLEVPAQIVYGQHDGTLVLLSVPPTSVRRFSAYYMKLRVAGKNVRECITKCSKGERVTNVDHPFFPWAFDEYTG
jgi:hypothetical protein